MTGLPNFSSPRGQIHTTRRTFGIGAALASTAALWLPGRALADDDQTDQPPAADALDLSAPPPDVTKAALSPLEVQVLALVNGARAARGITPLEWDPVMTAVSRAHAADMMAHGMVSHTGSDGSSPTDRLRRAGVKFRFGSENIWTYWGNTHTAGPSTMHAAMMAEPFAPGVWNHIGNILYGAYARIGVGIVVAPGGTQYLSETFAD